MPVVVFFFWLFAKIGEQEADSGHPSGPASFIQETHVDSAAILWHEDKGITLFNHVHFCRYYTLWDEYTGFSWLSWIQSLRLILMDSVAKILQRQIKAGQL